MKFIPIQRWYSVFFRNSLHRWLARSIVAIHMAMFGLLLFVWTRLPPQLPLYYSRPWGAEQIGTPQHLAILSGGSLLVFFLTITGAALLYAYDHFLGRLLFLCSCIICLLLLFSIGSIVLLVT